MTESISAQTDHLQRVPGSSKEVSSYLCFLHRRQYRWVICINLEGNKYKRKDNQWIILDPIKDKGHGIIHMIFTETRCLIWFLLSEFTLKSLFVDCLNMVLLGTVL